MDNHRTLSLASVILGALGILSSCLGYLCCCGLLFGLPALGCGALAFSSSSKDTNDEGEQTLDAMKSQKMAILGIVMALLAPILSLVLPFVLSFLGIGALSALGSSLESNFDEVSRSLDGAVQSIRLWL